MLEVYVYYPTITTMMTDDMTNSRTIPKDYSQWVEHKVVMHTKVVHQNVNMIMFHDSIASSSKSRPINVACNLLFKRLILLICIKASQKSCAI